MKYEGKIMAWKSSTWVAMLMLAGSGMMAPNLGAQTIVLNDEFDDNAVVTNSKGVGSGWQKEMQGTSTGKKQDVIEENGLWRFTKAGDEHRKIEPQGSDHDNVQLRSKDDFSFFDNTGVTVEYALTNAMASGKQSGWTSKMTKDHPGCSAGDWLVCYGLVSKGEGDIYRNRKGGIYIQIYYKSNGAAEFNGRKESRDLDVLGNIRIVNKSKNQNGTNEELPGLHTPTWFTFPGYKGQDDLVVNLKANSTGWEFSFNKEVKIIQGSLKGEWMDPKSPVPITSEFGQGGRSFLMASKMANGYGTADVKYLRVTRGATPTALSQTPVLQARNNAGKVSLTSVRPSDAFGFPPAASIDGRTMRPGIRATRMSIFLPE